MKISIITVTFNSEKTLRYTIESVLNQNYDDIEYLIIDGGSTDSTLDIIKCYEPKFEGKLHYISEPDKGIYDAMNKGILMATGNVVGFLNSDEDNKLYDEKQNEIAEAIAGAILGTLSEETIEVPVYYRVQTGAYRNRENADRMLYQLNDQGYPAFLLYENDLYKVQVGAFQQIGNAINMEQRLRDDGYSTVIVTK